MFKKSTGLQGDKTLPARETREHPEPWGERGGLNVFQRLVRQWESLHPYNGAQVLKIEGEVDLQLCRSAWLDALAALNLGVVSIQKNSYRYRRMNGEAIYHGVAECPAGTRLEEWISSEMNRPFDDGQGVPFRPFVIRESGHFWMGLCYQHWVADSTSIRMLIHEWFARQFKLEAAINRPLRIHAGGYLSLFGPHCPRSRPGSALAATMRWHEEFRRVRRIEDPVGFRDMAMGFELFNAPPGLIDSVCKSARSAGAKVNDLFLAAIARVCDEFVPAEAKFRRRQLAIGSIADLRPSAGKPVGDVFDLLLGFAVVRCKAHEMNDWRKLVGAIARQTQDQKLGALPLSSFMRMGIGLIAGKWLSREKVMEFYRKRVSLAGANSNVNVNRCWAGKYAGCRLLDYVRVAPTGPMTPLVFATTTFGSNLSVGLTYRPAIVPAETARRAGARFIEYLHEISTSLRA
jgi:hypothetical protein